jgi:dTDP-4-dehydrorhamnose 3,5-epimerase
MSKYKFIKTPIPGIMVIELPLFSDARGFFVECYRQGEFERNGIAERFVQDNLSRSRKGVLRGLHYQVNPSPMGKLIRVMRGKIFDVGVDVRVGSSTFGKWNAEILSEENRKAYYLPPGIAHGFLALEDDTDVFYKCGGVYSPKDERAIIWNDPELAIAWPLKEVKEVILSDRDKQHPFFKQASYFE